MIDNIGDDIQHRRDDARATRTAGHHHHFALIQHNRRTHRGQWPFAWRGGIGTTAHQPEGIGYTGFGGKIIQLVVEHHTGAFGDHAQTVGEVQRIGVGNRIAFRIHDRIMGGLVALVRGQLTRFDLARRTGFCGINLLDARLRIAFGCERCHRNSNEIGIAEIFRTVGIGDFHRLGEQMQPVGIGCGRLRQFQCFQHVENFDHMHPA